MPAVEVEPENPLDALDDATRRIRFYERHGAQIITETGHYLMPTSNGQPPIPMRLMWANLDGRTPLLTLDEIRRWIQGIFETVYPAYPRCATTRWRDCLYLEDQFVFRVKFHSPSAGVSISRSGWVS